jgi:hypothetical protein
LPAPTLAFGATLAAGRTVADLGSTETLCVTVGEADALAFPTVTWPPLPEAASFGTASLPVELDELFPLSFAPDLSTVTVRPSAVAVPFEATLPAWMASVRFFAVFDAFPAVAVSLVDTVCPAAETVAAGVALVVLAWTAPVEPEALLPPPTCA